MVYTKNDGVHGAHGGEGGMWRFRVYSSNGIEMLGRGLVHAVSAEQATSKVRGVRSRYRDGMIFVQRLEEETQ